EAEGTRIVGVARDGAFARLAAVDDALALALGVVRNAVDEGGPALRPAEAPPDPFEQARFVVRGPDLALVGHDQARGPVERVVRRRCAEDLVIEQAARGGPNGVGGHGPLDR